MRIFLTGGTGYIGSAVLDAFVKAGHQVDALVRNSEKAERVQGRGATPVLGDAANPATFADAAAASDGVVLAAFEDSPRGVTVDVDTIDAVLATPVKPGKFLIYTSGIWVLGPAPASVDETARLNPIEHVAWRPAHEQRVLDAATAGWRPVVIRPGIVYGGHGGIVGDGDNHWPLVYDRDLADLYVRAATNPDASGVYHANDEGDETVNDIVRALSDHAKTEPSVRHVPLVEAKKKMGTYAEALALDQIVRSQRARALGWQPSLHSVSGNAARLFEEWGRKKS